MVSTKVSEETKTSPIDEAAKDEQLASDDECAVDDSNTPTTTAEGKVLTAKQKKYLRRKIRDREKKAKLANSLVRELPEDPLEETRKSLLESLQKEFDSLPSLATKSNFEVLAEFADHRRALEQFAQKIRDEANNLQNKSLKPLIRAYDIETLVEEIQEKELEEKIDQDGINFRFEELKRHLSAENQKKFIDATNKILAQVETTEKMNDTYFTRASDANRKGAIVDRLSTMKQIQDPEAPPLTANQVIRVIVDFDLAVAAVLFYPQNIHRRLESQFSVVIEKPRSSVASNNISEGSDGNRRRQQNPRAAEIWGLESDVERVVNLLKNGNFTSQLRHTVERSLLPSIIGKGGSGIRKLETDNDCVVLIEDCDVVVLGTEKSAQAVFSSIDQQKNQRQVDQVTMEVVIEPLLARALIGNHSSKIRNIETEFKTSIRVIAPPNQNQTNASPPNNNNANIGIGKLVVRCKASDTEKIKKSIQKDIVEPFSVLIFTSSGRAINRLLFPPKGPAPEQARAIPNEFRNLRDALSVYAIKLTSNDEFKNSTAAILHTIHDPSVVADNERDKDNTDRIPLSSDSVHLGVVCAKVDVPTVESKIKDLMKRACRMSARVPIERDQLRIFTPETRALIEESSGCAFSVNTSSGDRSLPIAVILHGTAEEITSAKTIVAEILAREGCVRELVLKSPETVMQLIRNKGAKIQSFETEFRVSISVRKETKTVRLLGLESAVIEAEERIREIDNQIITKQQNIETHTMLINSRNLPQLIGRSGQMLSQIRRESGIDSIRIPTEAERMQSDGSTSEQVSISILGESACIQSAVDMIEQLMSRIANRDSNNNNNNNENRNTSASMEKRPASSWTGRGRGRTVNGNSNSESRGPRGGGRPASYNSSAQWVGLDKDDSTSYPALGANSDSPAAIGEGSTTSNQSPLSASRMGPSTFAAMTANKYPDQSVETAAMGLESECYREDEGENEEDDGSEQIEGCSPADQEYCDEEEESSTIVYN